MLSLKEMSVVSSIVGAGAVMAWRGQESRSAVTLKKIIIPPLGMATGFCMFIAPPFRIPWQWAAAAFLLGATALAYPLLRTSRLVREGEAIVMQRSHAFFFVVAALAVIRILARSYIDRYIDIQQTGALFFVLAFGMILRWRLRMLFEYHQLTTE